MILTVSFPLRYDWSAFFFAGCPDTAEGETLVLPAAADDAALVEEPLEEVELAMEEEDGATGVAAAALPSFLGLLPCLLSGG